MNLAETFAENSSARVSVLLSYANTLTSFGHRAEALRITREAVEISRKMAEVSPENHRLTYLQALKDFSVDLGNGGKFEEQAQVCAELVAQLRSLHQQFPGHFLRDLARALTGLAEGLNGLGRTDDALLSMRESREIWGSLYISDRHGAAQSFAESLINESAILIKTGRNPEALVLCEQALTVCEEFNDSQSEHQAEELSARCFSALAAVKANLEDYDEAHGFVSRAIAVRRAQQQLKPLGITPSLCLDLTNEATILEHMNALPESVIPLREVVSLYEHLIEEEFDQFASKYAESLDRLAEALRRLSEKDEEIHARRKQIEILEQLHLDTPNQYRQKLISATNSYTKLLSSEGNEEAAIAAFHRCFSSLEKSLPSATDPAMNSIWILVGEYSQTCLKANQEIDLDAYAGLIEVILSSFPGDMLESIRGFAHT